MPEHRRLIISRSIGNYCEFSIGGRATNETSPLEIVRVEKMCNSSFLPLFFSAFFAEHNGTIKEPTTRDRIETGSYSGRTNYCEFKEPLTNVAVTVSEDRRKKYIRKRYNNKTMI